VLWLARLVGLCESVLFVTLCCGLVGAPFIDGIKNTVSARAN
jgi:hypothetical protein